MYPSAGGIVVGSLKEAYFKLRSIRLLTGYMKEILYPLTIVGL